MILESVSGQELRLSHYLKSELQLSRHLINHLKFRDAILVNGSPVHTDYIVKPGDRVSVVLEEEAPEYPAQEGPLEILYEDEAVIALDKPAGILVHPSHSRNEGTLANYLAWYYQQTGQKCAVHPVSRLDRDTFGVVLLAKNAHYHAKMVDAHAAGLIGKTYTASVWDPSLPDTGRIDAPIIRVSPIGMLRAVGEGGQQAATEYRVLERHGQCALVELHPLTGRTHQLRVHMAHIGHPILGDPQYGSEASAAYSAQFALPWQQLCASALEFPHPATGERMELRSKQRVVFPE